MSELSLIVKFLEKANELEIANTLLDTFAKYAVMLEQFDELGNLYFTTKEYKKALDMAHRVLGIAVEPEHMYATRANLAKIYNQINYPEKSLVYSNINASVTPMDYDVRLEQMMSYFLLNEDRNKPKQMLEAMLKEENLPEQVKDRIEFNLGTYDLMSGNFQQGLKRFMLTGKKLGLWFVDSIKKQSEQWDGTVQPGKNIIVLGEGGIGDEFISIRFIKNFIDLGMNPIWLTNHKLNTIFNRNGFPCISNIKDIPADCVWTYGMATPIPLNLTEKDLWNGPYIKPDPQYVDKWKWIKTTSSKPKVGIRWAGNPKHDLDLHRSVPLDQLYEVLKEFDFELFSLQKGPGENDCDKYNYIHNLSDQIESYEDTLGIIENLDFVVSSCTSVVHASASMGKKICVIVPIAAYYTWSHTQEQSPWYGDNLKLFRQEKPRCWNQPLEELKEFLNAYNFIK